MRRLVLAAAMLIACPLHAQVPEGVDPSFLAVSVDGEKSDQILTAWQVDGQWAMGPEDWKSAGVVLTEEEAKKDALTATELGAGFAVNEDEQSVEVTLPADRIPPQRLNLRPVIGELSPAAPGVLLSYSLAGQVDRFGVRASAGYRASTAGRWGQLSTSGQANFKDGQLSHVRGDTRWQFDDYKRRITYQVGDVATTTAKIGGVRVAKDLALDPFTPTYPVPEIGGIAVDQGTIDFLINKAKVSQVDVKKGPFTLESYPLSTGRSSLDVVIRDQFGREEVIDSRQFYLSTQLLRKGLTTWSVAAGKVRQGAEHYGTAGAEATFARGMTDNLTVLGSAQATRGHRNTMVGVKTKLGLAGVLEVEAGQSRSDDRPDGRMLSARYTYQADRFSITAAHERREDYWQLSEFDQRSVQTKSRDQVAVNWSSQNKELRARVGYTKLVTEAAGGEQVNHFAEGGLAWQRGAHGASVTALYDLENKEPSFGVGYRYQFGRTSTYATARQAPDVTRFAVGAATTFGTGSKQVAVQGEVSETNGQMKGRLSASTRTTKGNLRLELQQDQDGTVAGGELVGAIHIGRGGIHALGPVSDGYAVVDVAGVPGVPVRANGRDLGVTDARGQLVINNLPVLVPSTITIDDRALPPDVQLEKSEVTITPRRGAGASVSFPLRTQNARTFIVSRVPALEAGAQVKTDVEETVMGFEGVLFLEHPKAAGKILITDGQGTCEATLPVTLPAWDEQPSIECVVTAPR